MYILNSFSLSSKAFTIFTNISFKYLVILIDADNTRQSGDRSIISISQDKAIKLHEESLLYAYGSIKGQR